MRPRATMAAFRLTVVAMSSFVPPPAYATAPVSPLSPCKRWSPFPEPTTHTIALLAPSVVVTHGDPWPLWLTLQAGTIVGGFVAVTLYAEIAVLPSRKTKYFPLLVR